MTSTTEHAEAMFDFGFGPVPAHRHQNPDGTIGGWVANTAQVSGEAWVFGEARVFGKAQVLQVGPMGSRNALLTIYPEARRIVCSTGCFENKTLAELLAACAKTHGPDSPHTRDYTLLATAAFAVLEARIADANSGGPKDG